MPDPVSRVAIVFGTRPEAIKLFPLIHAMRADPRFAVQVIVTAQHRAMLDQVLDFAGIVPDTDLDIMTPGQSLDTLTARLLDTLGPVFDAGRFDRVIVQGDTATAMVAALAAYYRKIPVAHVEAGLRSHDIYQPWPEEVNRKIVGSIADLHFAPTQTAADALRAENVPADRIHVTGNTVIDALHMARDRLTADPARTQGLDDLATRFAGKRVVLVTTHRRENFGPGMASIARAIARIAAREDVGVVFPVHPNPQVTGVMNAILGQNPRVAMIGPQDYPHFVRLLDLCHLVLTDSGGVQEEAPGLGKPVLVMRETTERPEGVIAGTAKLIGADEDRIVAEVGALLDDPAAYAAMARAHNPFGDGHASTRIVETLCA
ncbi:UDP-N-acetyl glucosamine 2-epimerase [Sphingomonas sp. Leaf407]|uniref:non-hydrolyzing UDP-N-acetylglucosamine 2-epimerase n=1 Tax=unclassified Sphingomonas TaxID=196159 RepID=UPI0006FA35CC|nr:MULTISPECIES: UDP-N-acetylglucosamine 2-epimerase (non-hydrolyzing) [unclassified Sphingomonas]KQN37392.1 UDP-N-acetyl glucosamine 2-epimerase [Sphingomonas sp. Leaf42]KQT27761.1 UDP-N-acetyl glucosamine 2-epimerase [Sphingomonas sp. Leaf407]